MSEEDDYQPRGTFSVSSTSSDDDDDVEALILRTPTAPFTHSIQRRSAYGMTNSSAHRMDVGNDVVCCTSKITFDEDEDDRSSNSKSSLVSSAENSFEMNFDRDDLKPDMDVAAEMEVHLLKLKLGHLTTQNRTLFYRNERMEKQLRMHKHDQAALDLLNHQHDSVRLEVLRGDQLHLVYQELESERKEVERIKLQFDELQQKVDHDVLLNKAQQQEIQRLTNRLAQRSVVESDAARRLQELTVTSLRTEEHLVEQKEAAEASLAQLRHQKDSIEEKLNEEVTERSNLMNENSNLKERLRSTEITLQDFRTKSQDLTSERNRLLKELDEIKSRDARQMDSHYEIEVSSFK